VVPRVPPACSEHRVSYPGVVGPGAYIPVLPKGDEGCRKIRLPPGGGLCEPGSAGGRALGFALARKTAPEQPDFLVVASSSRGGGCPVRVQRTKAGASGRVESSGFKYRKRGVGVIDNVVHGISPKQNLFLFALGAE